LAPPAPPAPPANPAAATWGVNIYRHCICEPPLLIGMLGTWMKTLAN
jgi:hypothetical protein